MAARYHIPLFRLGNHACESNAESTLNRISLALLCGLFLLTPGCGESDTPEHDPADDIAVGELIPDDRVVVPVPHATTPRDHAVLEVAGHGDIRIELLSDVAPKTVDRFIELAAAGFYDGTTFHRILPGFMIQGGDPNSQNRDPRDDGLGRSGLGKVPDEFSDISHLRGIVSFANAGRRSSGDCQFFLMVGDNLNLDGGYSVFGQIVAGQEVAEAISLVERDKYGRWGPKDRPREDVVITTVRIEPAEGSAVGEGGPAPSSSPSESSVAAPGSAG